MIAVYNVCPEGWTKVWSGDVNEQYYKYYPIETALPVPPVVEGGVEEKAGST